MQNSDRLDRHDRLVSHIEHSMRKAEFTDIVADLLQSDNKPPVLSKGKRLKKYRPDIIGKLKGRLHVLEVKTDDDLFSEETRDQLKHFSNWVDNNKKACL